MSSRILQQNNDALLTQANEFIVNENFIAANSIVTGSPVVDTTGITQDHNSTPSSISTGSPTVSSTAITQDHNLSPSDVSSGQVIVANTAITQRHDLSSTSITSGQPVVATSGITQDHNLDITGIVAGQVVISTSGLIQNHSLQANDLATASPVIPSVDATELENFTVASIVTGLPTVGQPSFTQVHNIGLSDVETPSPIVESASDPNAIIILEIREIEQMFGGWQRRTYEVPDGKLVQAEREIQATFGDVVSIDKKAKSLIKFGKSASLPTNTLQTIWTVGGNEVYVSDNTITHVSSSSALDTQEVTIEGHTVSGTGFDQEFTFVTQNVITTGQTPVALTTPLARTSRMYNNNGQELVGRVVVYEDTPVVGGIPSDQTKIHIDIPTGFQSSFKAATTFSNEDYYIITGTYGAVSLKQTAAVDFYLEVRLPGKTFRQVALFTASSSGGAFNIEFDPSIIIPKNADVRLRCESSSNNAVAFGVFKGYLAKVTG
jgi:hypothetical protein